MIVPTRAALVVTLVLGGCGLLGGGSAGWVSFNADDQDVVVPVGPDARTEDQSLVLLSTTESVEVGDALISPGGGPVGTEHSVIVTVLDDFEDQVERVTVLTSGERGDQTHVLVRDSADPGLWQISVQSQGAEGESREDTFTVRLWTPAEDGEEADPDAEADDS